MATVAPTSRFTTSTLASSTAGPFNVGFRLFESDAITVYVDGILNEDWTLTADLDSGYDDAATITFDAAQDSGSVIWIEGSMNPERSEDYGSLEPRLTDKMNAELPRIWAALIETTDRSKKSLRATTAIPPIDLTGDDDVTIIWKDGRLQIGPTVNEVSNAQAYALAASEARDQAEVWAEAATAIPEGYFASLTALRDGLAGFGGDDGARLAFPDGALIADSNQGSWSASPAIIGFRPENGILTTEMFGTTSELVSDGKGRLEQAIDDCCANDWKLKLNPIIDGSPYEWNYIDHDISGRLHLIFDPRAEFYRTTAFQVFDTDGTTGPFVIDAWDYQGAATEGISVMHVDSSGNETILAVTSGYTEALNGSNYEITTVATYPIGGYIVAASTKQILGLNGTAGAGDTVIVEGQAKFNMARCGYVLASASGTAFNCTRVDNIEVPGLVHGYGTAASGPDAAPQLRRGDTVFTANQYKHLSITGELRGDYINDLIFYGTGGGTTGGTDNPERAFINYISGINPKNGLKFVRETRGAHINYVNLIDPWAGFVHGVTSGLAPGAMISIGSMKLQRVRRRALDIGETDGSLYFGNVMVEDFGRAAGGGAVYSDAAAVFLSDANGVTINNLDVRMRDWTAPTSRPAVQLGGSDNWGNRIVSGQIRDLDIGINETGSTTNDKGNDFNLTMVNVTTPLSLHSDSRATYDITTITESGGTISATGRLHRKAFKETFTPNLLFASNPAPSHARENGTYIFDGANTLQFAIDAQVNGWTHSDTGILRLTMPDGYVGGALNGEPQAFTVSAYSGLNVDAQATSPGELSAILTDGADYLQFRFSETAGGTGDFLNQSAVTSGATVRVVVSGIALVNQA